MHRTKYIFLFLLAFIFANAQDKMEDSLLKIVATAADTTKVQMLDKLSAYVTRNNPAKGEVYADSALRLALRMDYKKGIAMSYNSLAYAQTTIGKYDESIQNLHKAIDVYTKINSKKGLTNTYNTLANAYLGLKDNAKAEKYYYASYELASKEPVDKHMIAISSVGLGNVMVEQKKFAKAIDYFSTAEKEFIGQGSALMAAYTTGMIGEAHYQAGNYDAAERYIKRAIPVFERNNDEYALGLNNYNLGSIEFKRENFAKAIKYLTISYNFSMKRKAWDNIQENARMLAEAHEYNHTPAEALKYYKVYQQFKDSVINKDRNKAIADAESKWESEKKEQQLKLKNSELEKSQLQVNQRNHLIYVFGGAIVIFIVLLLFVYRQVKAKQRANVLLVNKNEEIEKQKALIEEKNKDITDSINYSRHIQQAILPSAEKVKQHLPNSFVIFKPKDIVSGDFYLVEEIVGLTYLAVVDCTGHGVPGAMLSVFANSTIKNTIATNDFRDNPAAILSDLCFQFKSNLQSNKSSLTINDGVDMSICIIDKANNKLFFAGAKNSLMMLRKGQMTEFSANRWGISGTNTGEQLFFTNHVIDLEPNDKFYLSTDGFIDQFGGPKGKKLKQKQLKEMVTSYSGLGFDEQADRLVNDFNVWKGILEQLDDVTLLGFEV